MHQPMDSVHCSVLIQSLEGRPILISEIFPLSGALRTMKEGFVGLDGEVDLGWPADGALRLLRVDCAGSTWTLPVVNGLPEGTVLLPAPPGRAPFADRPGAVRLGTGPGDRPVERLAAFGADVEEVESDAAVEWQRQWLLGNAERGGELEVLGGRIGERTSGRDSMSETVDRSRLRLDSVFVAASRGAGTSVMEYLKALHWRTMLDLPGTDLDAALADWKTRPAPGRESPGEVLFFVEGAMRFATVDVWPDTLVQRHNAALDRGDFKDLISTTSNWWGQWDAAKTEAWLLMRFGMDGFGVHVSGAPFVGREWPDGLERLLGELVQRPALVGEVRTLQDSWSRSGALPSGLRCFDQREELTRIDAVVGSGPALWLWIDASAPSTTVQLQVLEHMIGEMRDVSRDFTWVVADAGSDWMAFLELHRQAVERAGSIKRMPFEMIHTGADIRWTRAFELSALPSVRYHGQGLLPIPRDLPLPGPELSGWLARRP